MDKWFRGQLQYDILGISMIVILIVGVINMILFNNSDLGIYLILGMISTVMLLALLNGILMILYSIYKLIKYIKG